MRPTISIVLSSLLALACSPSAAPPPIAPQPSTEPAAQLAAGRETPTVAGTGAGRADATLLPRKLLFGNPDQFSPRLSPDGKQIAFIAPDEGVLNIWIAPTSDPKKAKVVTHERARPIRNLLWAFTNRHVLYLNDQGGDENFHLFAADVSSAQEKDLTPFEGVRVENPDTFETRPTLVFATMNKRDKQHMDPMLVDVKTGTIQILAENTEGFAGFVTDHDAKLRVALKLTPDGGSELFVPAAKKGEWTSFAKIPQEDVQTTEPLFFERNNRTLYWRDSRGRDTSALVGAELPAGKPKVVFEDSKSDVEQLLVKPRQETVQAVATNRERRVWHVLDKSIQADLDALAKVTPGDLQIVSRSLDDRRWIASYLRDDGPTGYYLWDRDKKQAAFLFSDRPGLEGKKLAAMQPMIIKSRDGLELVSYLSLPPGADTGGAKKPDRPLPTVLFVHGGPWARDQWGFNAQHQWLASRGYAVLSVNYRASTGFGKSFLNAGDHEWAGKMHDDLLDAVKWAVDQKIADPAKIAIMGGSYGGYATLVGLTFTPDVFACGVDIVGPSNLVTLLNSIPPYWAPLLNEFTHRIGDHRTEEGKKFLFEHSALSRVEAIKKPLLIGQGANDPRVKQAESDQIVQAMRAKHLPVTYVLYPDEGHGFARPQNRLSFYAVAEAFLARHLGGAYQPVGDDFKGSSITVAAGAEQVDGLGESLGKKN